MGNPTGSLVWRLLILLAALPLVGASAPDRDLERIQRKIAAEKRGLSQLRTKEGSMLKSLSKVESELDRRAKKLKLTEAKLASLTSALERTRAETERLNHSVAARLELLRSRLGALYRWSKSDGSLHPHGAASQRRYLETAISFDRALWDRLEDESRRQEALRRELADSKARLDGATQTLSAAKDAILRDVEKKKVLLASLRREKEQRLRALQEMEAASRRLARMLDEIARRSAPQGGEPPGRATGRAHFDTLRGRLDWPVRGELAAPFGRFKHPEFAAEIFRNGIDIDAPIGEEIKSVEKGRVVYADRFAGYGRTVIVDHGERYFTIYAHLSEIFKKSGEEVSRGEVLGTVGEGDLLAGSKLYFEMRKDGRSIDPVPWFRKR